MYSLFVFIILITVYIRLHYNKIIEGNPDKIKFVTDNWKFTRNIKQKDPNWYLSEIISK